MIASFAVALTALCGVAAAEAASPAPAAQLTGVRLAGALLPASAFPRGYRYDRSTADNSGRKLETAPAKYHLATMSCKSFGNAYDQPGFGETAAAGNSYSTLVDNYTSTTGSDFSQAVYQFASGRAAAAFWRGFRAVLARCPALGLEGKSAVRIATVLFPGLFPGGQAFQVLHTWTFPKIGTARMASLVVVTGNDVFETDAMGDGRPVPATPSIRTLMHNLIARVHGTRLTRGVRVGAFQPG